MPNGSPKMPKVPILQEGHLRHLTRRQGTLSGNQVVDTSLTISSSNDIDPSKTTKH